MSNPLRFRIALAALTGLLLATPPLGAEEPSPAATPAAPPYQPDPRNGEDINLTCAACHGQWGEGSKGGVYPRLAGQVQGYLEEQLRSFKNRHRINIPMFPYAQDRELPEFDLQDVAAFLTARRITVGIKPSDGDVAEGERIYADSCQRCHGEGGRGKEEKNYPALSGQYPDYLFKQLQAFRSRERPGKKMQNETEEMTDQQFHDVIAYLSRQERHPGLAEEQAADTARSIEEILKNVMDAPAP